MTRIPPAPTAALVALAGALALGGPACADDDGDGAATVYDHEVQTIDGAAATLGAHRGKVLLIVNTASRCGFTGQYEGLEKLWRERKEAGLVVLGFPSNDFGGQEPGTNEQVKLFCEERYDVSFPLFAKVKVKDGDGQHPLYKALTSGATNAATKGAVRWNFTKFLVGRDGRVVARFDSRTAPDARDLREAIERELAKPAPSAEGGAPEGAR